MPATGALVQFGACAGDIKLIAPDAVEGNFAALEFEAAMLTAIVVKPKP